MLDREEQERGYCGRCYIPGKGGSNPLTPPSSKPVRKPAAKPPEKKTPPPPSAPAAPPAPKKVLIIDDEPVIVKFLSNRLAANGYKVVTAEDGEEGYLKIKVEMPDLVLSDILMPRLTGYDLVQKLKKEKDGTEKIPVLIMTAKPSMKDFFSDWEIHGFIPKPIVPEDLLQKIAYLIERAELLKRAK